MWIAFSLLFPKAKRFHLIEIEKALVEELDDCSRYECQNSNVPKSECIFYNRNLVYEKQ